MPQDQLEEWRRLTTLYSEMGEIEIQELADQISNLTPAAQQVLRDEMKKRGMITEPSATISASSKPGQAVVHWERWEDTAADTDGDESEDAGRDYTWKTALCRCDSLGEAASRCEMLRRAGIDTWIQRPGSRFLIPWVDELGVGDIQINVAADQLDQAQMIVAQPIPPDILAQIGAEEETPEYEIPVCPKCKAPDPTLESIEPTNNWLCEACGYTWSDPTPESIGG